MIVSGATLPDPLSAGQQLFPDEETLSGSRTGEKTFICQPAPSSVTDVVRVLGVHWRAVVEAQQLEMEYEKQLEIEYQENIPALQYPVTANARQRSQQQLEMEYQKNSPRCNIM